MALRWRKDGTLLCAAKFDPEKGDTFINNRLHYLLHNVLEVVVPHEDEKICGIWYWCIDDDHVQLFLQLNQEKKW